MNEPSSKYAARHPLAFFFTLAFALPWGGSLPTYMTAPQGGEALPPYLSAPGVILTLLGPSVAALIAERLTSGSAGPRQLLGRLRIWRIGWGWYALLFLYPPSRTWPSWGSTAFGETLLLVSSPPPGCQKAALSLFS